MQSTIRAIMSTITSTAEPVPGRQRAETEPADRHGLAAEDGAATAEYAIATLAAVGFAGLLVVILRSDQVRAMLTDLIERALTVAG